MTQTTWSLERTQGPIVRQNPQVPDYEALDPLPKKIRLQPGQPMNFSLDVIVEPLTSGAMRGYMPGPTASANAWEIQAHEVSGRYSTAEAPPPLYYLVAGAGFCLMSHIAGFLDHSALQVRRVKIEMRGNFMTTHGHQMEGLQGEGGCDSFETYVILDSDEPAEKLQEFLEVCERACIASQTLANAVPSMVKLVLNGETLAN
ncbi:OsmC family protein [Salinibacterium sp. ZJ454]|uniref:OsmC family protein n=1 Tax=Salinibacterium sp. ZJ454 TaxID=2708339 RepID=UPI00141E27CE|nr:OsmC family protein [Salinibacterium sp. ZJ454]